MCWIQCSARYGIRPIKITIDRRTVWMDIEGEQTTFDHEDTEQGTTQASRQTSEGLEAHIREVHLGRSFLPGLEGLPEGAVLGVHTHIDLT